MARAQVRIIYLRDASCARQCIALPPTPMSYSNSNNYSIFGGSELTDKLQQYLGANWAPILAVMVVLIIVIIYQWSKSRATAEAFASNYSGGAGNTRYTNSDSVYFNSGFTPMRTGCGGQAYVSDDYKAEMGADIMAGIAADAAGTDDDSGSADLNLVPVTTSSFRGGLGGLKNTDLFSPGRPTIGAAPHRSIGFTPKKTEANLASMLY